MALINTSVPNLIQGVSQQPDATRFDGQCEEQENALSSVAEGLKKRPNTRHVARLLQTAIDANSFVHFINRDDEEKYVVIHTGSGIEAWNIVSGVKCSINGYTTPLTPPSYLETTTPRQSLKALTVADNTFIVNKEISAGLSQTKTAPLDKKGFVYIAQGDYEKKYQINVGGNLNGTVPSNQATFDIAVESYYWSKGWEKFRVANVSITNAGSGYPATTPDILELSFNWGSLGSTVYASYNTIDITPVIQVTFEDDGTVDANGVSNGTKRIATATVATVGKFAQHNAQVTGASFADNYSASITGTVAGDTVGGAEYSFATVGDNDTKSYMADTTEIATSLFDDSAYPADFASSPLVTTNAAGNIFTTGTNFTDPPLTATREGGTIIIKSNVTGGDFTLTTEDGLAGNGIKAVYKRIDALSDLPVKAPNNFVVEIVGDADLEQDNYWVKFTTNNGTDFGDGAWEECVAPNVSDGLDASSMPMTIRNTNFNTLEITAIDYAKRNVGDEDTNPNPSFVGQGINDIVFFKNRLGFITDDSVVFSEAGEFFNFYRTTVSSLLDSGPIDITVSSTKVTKLKSATIFQENLMLFSDNVQFVMKGGDLFTPKTVSVSPTTNFSLEDSVAPTPLGSYVYFPFTRGSYTGLRELALSANTETYDAVEVTEHVPAYIPSNIIAMTGTTSEDMIALLSADEKGSLYIYNYFWNNNQKVLSAWSKFTFTGEIRGIEFIDSSLYAVITNNDETNLVEMPLESGLKDNAGYVTHLDSRVSATVDNGSDTITLPYTPEDNSVQVYTTDGLALNCTNSGATVTLAQAVNDVDENGDPIDTDVWVGIPYTMKYTFSEQLFKAKAGNGKSPSNAAKMMIRNGSLYYDNTSYFKVKVTPKFRDTYENIFTPDVVGSSTLGSLSLDSGFYRFPVFTKPQDTTITIENESALPSTFQSAEFESFVHTRSNRYG